MVLLKGAWTERKLLDIMLHVGRAKSGERLVYSHGTESI